MGRRQRLNRNRKLNLKLKGRRVLWDVGKCNAYNFLKTVQWLFMVKVNIEAMVGLLTLQSLSQIDLPLLPYEEQIKMLH